MPLKSSAAVLTQDSEEHIKRCLESLVWADEIIVVDAFSEDGTPEICQDREAPWAGKMTFLQRAWTGFDDQRNYYLEKAAHDWILAIDSDEKCSEALRDRVQALLSKPSGPPLKAYKVRRQEYFLGQPIHWGIWNPSYQDRFFYRAGVKYVNKVHEYPVFPSEPGRIHEPIEHDPNQNPVAFLNKMNKYTTIEAKDRFDQGMRTNAFRLFFAFFAMFLKNYFYYKAYRDGFHGFVISLLEGVSRVVRHIKIWQLQIQKKPPHDGSE